MLASITLGLYILNLLFEGQICLFKSFYFLNIFPLCIVSILIELYLLCSLELQNCVYAILVEHMS